jgi:osmotically-inducible protein OsmY
MAWLQRLFGEEEPKAAHTADLRDVQYQPTVDAHEAQDHPPEQTGLQGAPDEQGLAKRVALAFDHDDELKNIDNMEIEQDGTLISLKGEAPDQETLAQLISTAQGVEGITAVNSDKVTIAAR